MKLVTLLAAFEAGMPLLGLRIGHILARGLGDVAKYVATALLIGVGGYAAKKIAGVHGLAALALAFSISLDGLAIGFTYGLLKLPIAVITAQIATQALFFCDDGFCDWWALAEFNSLSWRVTGELGTGGQWSGLFGEEIDWLKR